MKTETHGNGNGLDDLYVLPQGKHSALYIATVAKFHGLSSQLSYSDCEEQDWYGKHFVEIPFGCNLRAHFEEVDDGTLKLWRVTFTGRKVNAIGITYPCSFTIPAQDAHEARELLYATHEHISNLKVKEVE